jgi:hypothetical protein
LVVGSTTVIFTVVEPTSIPMTHLQSLIWTSPRKGLGWRPTGFATGCENGCRRAAGCPAVD